MSCGSTGTVNHFFTLLNDLTIMDKNRLVLTDQRFVGDAVVAGDDQALLALRFLAKGHRARHFGEHAGHPSGCGLQRVRQRAADRR